MKAAEIADRLIDELCSGAFRHARVNFANGDMVGHTGHREATITAMQALDLQLGRLLEATRQLRGALIVTADHGNADCMYELEPTSGAVLTDATGEPQPKTSHTLNAVPCFIFAPEAELRLAGLEHRGLAHVAATTLQLLGYAAPSDYAPSLLAP